MRTLVASSMAIIERKIVDIGYYHHLVTRHYQLKEMFHIELALYIQDIAEWSRLKGPSNSGVLSVECCFKPNPPSTLLIRIRVCSVMLKRFGESEIRGRTKCKEKVCASFINSSCGSYGCHYVICHCQPSFPWMIPSESTFHSKQLLIDNDVIWTNMWWLWWSVV